MITKNIQSNRHKHFKLLSLPLAISLATFAMGAGAEEDGMWEMSLEDLGSTRVTSIASGTKTPLDKAAAIVTVISEKDIEAMGATELDQILETVPGLHVGISDQAYASKYNFRGITSSFNAQALMLINGIPITELVFGNRGNVWAGMPVKAISKIEVIRGPGSAMYGADAFSGVINIITKSRKDINGTFAGGRAGSFDTQGGWLQHGDTYNGLDIGFSLEYETTDGHREIIEADAFGFSGPVNRSTDMIDAWLDVRKENHTFRLGYQDRTNIGTGAGILPLLDPHGRFGSERIFADYTHAISDLTPDWGIKTQASYYYGTQNVEENILLAPPSAFGPTFPDGFIGNPEFKEHNATFSVNGTFRGIDKHTITVGTGYFWGDIFEVTESKNFDTVIANDGSISFPAKPEGLVDVSDTDEVFLPERSRRNYHFFVQDEWQFANNWQLTSGIRYDHYSDFGETTNPRLALVWATTDTMTTKFLYGKAFRAPSITELFVTTNPVNLGTPENEPETIDTWEIGFSHQVNQTLNYNANTYFYEIEDLITQVTVGQRKFWQNTSKRKGYGAEIEIDYTPVTNLELTANYAYQKSKDKASNKSVGDAPNHQIYARLAWKNSTNWKISTQINWVGRQLRVPDDPTRTEPIPHYTTIDLKIAQDAITENTDISFTVKNLFDRDVIEPSSISSLAGTTAADYPMEGRAIYADLNYKF